jgi:hypothetical protein
VAPLLPPGASPLWGGARGPKRPPVSGFTKRRARRPQSPTAVPVAYVDAASMYPTVNSLLGTWGLLAAASTEAEDVTTDVRRLLQDESLSQRCFDPGFWRERIGVTLVELDRPAGQVLPVRAYYDAESQDPGIGVNPLRYEGRLWYSLPDVIASVLLASDVVGPPQGEPPNVRRAIRLRPAGLQAGLRQVRLRGTRLVDPAREDPFVRMVEERHRTRSDPALSEEDRDRLNLFLKITTNAAAYGVLARFDRRELAEPAKVTVFGPDDDSKEAWTSAPEDPGPLCFPPVAAAITAGARLLLALLERAVIDAGGAYAFCDTDSMGIVSRPGGGAAGCATPGGSAVRALGRRELREILDRFDSLNPYDRELVPSLWRVEHDSV